MNLIFDIGNVICQWNPDALVKRIFKFRNQQQEALNSIINHPDWVKLDKGIIDMEQAVVNADSRSFLEQEEIRRVYLETPMSLVPNAPVVEVVRDLKTRGYPLYILSNMQRHSWDWLFSKYDFWSLFDGIVVSYKIQMVKPDKEIFEYITGRYDLEPADTLFLDDTYVNIDAARGCGMQVLHVREVHQALSDLYEKLNIEHSNQN